MQETLNKIGFRLEYLEVLNWGTFNHNVWKITPNCFNSLLTGDIGSGKSTLVDAITTLFVPHNKIVYNKAAGADSKERTLLSYVRGEYKNEKDELTNFSKSVYLRSENNYSVILANFKNHSINQDITLAQVFWIKNSKVEKFYVISHQRLNIKDNFSNFGNDINNLKKELRKNQNTKIYDSFTEYSSTFRNIFGIKSDKALDLFYQTISMKSVGNLTDFVRNHMLEKFDVKSKIEDLKKRFEDLNEAYKTVQKAKEQLNKLEPLIEKSSIYLKINDEITKISKSIDILPVYFSEKKIYLLEEEKNILIKEINRINNQIDELEKELKSLREQEVELNISIKENEKGKVISKLDEEIRQKIDLKNKKIEKSKEYLNLVRNLELNDEINEEIFYESINKVRKMEENIKLEIPKLISERDKFNIKLNQLNNSISEILSEVQSLQNRKTQIPDNNIFIRKMICDNLKINEDELPYVGELIRVKDNEREWEGAIEKLLHNFGISMLVPERYYKDVSQLVNRMTIKGRLVYFRVPEEVYKRKFFDIPSNSLINKIEIRPDTEFYEWLSNELIERYNYICCNSIEQFQREPFAITKEGQIKVKSRHEKDDRIDIHDRRNYILGWNNNSKIESLRNEYLEIEKKINDVENKIKTIEIRQDYLLNKKNMIQDLLKFTDFSLINWSKDSLEIQELIKKKKEIEEAEDYVKTFSEQLNKIKFDIKEKEELLSQKLQFKGKNEQNLKDILNKIERAKFIINNSNIQEAKKYYDLINEVIKEDIEIDNIDLIQNRVRDYLLEKKNNKLNQEQVLIEEIIYYMSNYKKDYPAETNEIDVSIYSIPDFEKIYQTIKEEDLPKHEERFKDLLREKTIQSIVLFKNQLEIFEKDIEDKIKDINTSLLDIDYNPGTFIVIEYSPTLDKQIKDFKNELQECIEIGINEELYTEEKFNQVKKILDRFSSGDPINISWTEKVTDVRNWFTFTVSERWREDNSEKEFYSDSSGKSGGQKEKLAYTILASALAYQFGLTSKESLSRSFRFVVIDEAFGRGSDESTKYALELFKKINLQLLIVTPLQKINVIEDYINTIHFVSNPTGKNSVVRNLSKLEYIEEKNKFLNQLEEINV